MMQKKIDVRCRNEKKFHPPTVSQLTLMGDPVATVPALNSRTVNPVVVSLIASANAALDDTLDVSTVP